MWSDGSWWNLDTSLQTAAHLVAAMQKRLVEDGRNGLCPNDALRALRQLQNAVDGAVAAAEWDADEDYE